MHRHGSAMSWRAKTATIWFLLLHLFAVGASVRTVNAAPADNPKRIVSLAPSVTETIFALGLGDRLVGVTTYCDYPAAAKQLPKIGSFTNPSLEAIVARRP